MSNPLSGLERSWRDVERMWNDRSSDWRDSKRAEFENDHWSALATEADELITTWQEILDLIEDSRQAFPR